MAQVATIGCSFVKGVATGLRQRVMSWFSPGIDGQSALLLGFSDGSFRFSCVLYGALVDVLAWQVAMNALQGTVVSVVDDWGTTWGNLLVTRVSALDRTAATGNGITGGNCRGELRIEGLVVA